MGGKTELLLSALAVILIIRKYALEGIKGVDFDNSIFKSIKNLPKNISELRKNGKSKKV